MKPCGKESTEVQIPQKIGKDRKFPKEIKRSPDERHALTYGNLTDTFRKSQISYSHIYILSSD